MKKLFSRERLLVSCIFLFAVFMNIGVKSSNVMKQAQGNLELSQATRSLGPKPDKYVGQFIKKDNDPIEITEIRIKGLALQLNSKMKAKEDWLDGLSFKVKNKSGKNIVYLAVHLNLPETDFKTTEQPMMAYIVRYGADPKLPVPERAKGQTPLANNDEIEFTFSGEQYERLKRFVETRMPIQNINSVVIELAKVIFDDDTAWSSGAVQRRDPNNPARWIDIN